MGSTPREPLLEIKDLQVVFDTYAGEVKALNHVDLTLFRGETIGLVGESGCGKSVTASTIVGLLPENARVVGGEILLNGEDLLKKTKNQMRGVRANNVAMVFQDPTTFLNPVLTIGEQLEEVFELDQERIAIAALREQSDELENNLETSTDSRVRDLARTELAKMKDSKARAPRPDRAKRKKIVREMAMDVLKKVRLPDVERIMKEYPHELSGGMRQRCMIAMAIARNPDLLIADEITTALDVTIQAQILELLRILKEEFHSTILIITHDLGVVAETCDRVAVMYAGSVVEIAAVDELFGESLHPYTQGLLRAIPRFTGGSSMLESIPGSVPDLINPPTGCRFNPRCPHAWDLCQKKRPELLEARPNHAVACHLYTKERNE